MTDRDDALVVGPEHAGARLDVFLRAAIEGLGRAGAKRLVEEGRVRVNGRRAPKALALAEGDRVSVEALDADHAAVGAVADPELALDVVLEDPSFVVVNKEAGVPSQPLRPGERGTVANALVHRYPEMAGLAADAREAGLVHRLDVGTSGLLLAARTTEAYAALRGALTDGAIEKHYLALVGAALEAPSSIEHALASDGPRGQRMRACFSTEDLVRYDGKPATTEVLRVEPRGAFFLVEVRAFRAQRHQVRVHLAAEGAPLVGDALYGGPEADGVTHHLLHASFLGFDHPTTGERVELRSEPPATWPR